MMSIRSSVALIALAVVIAGGFVVLGATDRAYRRTLDSAVVLSMTAAGEGFEALSDARADRMEAALAMLGHSRDLREAYLSGDRARLQSEAWRRFETLRDELAITRWYFYGLDGTVFLRVYRGETEALDPAAFGDVSPSLVLAVARETDDLASGLELGRQALALRVIAPYRDTDGRVIGYIGLGERVKDYLAAVSVRTGDGYALFLSNERIDPEAWAQIRAQDGLRNNWDEHEDILLVESTLGDESILDGYTKDDIPAEAQALGIARRNGATYAVGVFPITDVGDAPVGAVYVLHDVSELSSLLRETQLAMLLVYVAVALAATLIISFVVQRTVFGRLDAALGEMERMTIAVVGGSPVPPRFDAEPPDDELGRFQRFFRSILELLAESIRASGARGEAPPDSRVSDEP